MIGGVREAVVAVLLAWCLRTEGLQVAPEAVADVSMLLAAFYEVDCVQIFRTEKISIYDTQWILRMWKRLAVVESKITTGVYSFALYMEKKTATSRKVSCYRSLKIMSDDEESKRRYAEFSLKFNFRDAIWVLYTDSFSLEFFESARVLFDDLIIIAETKSEDFILFHEVYRVSAEMPFRVLSLGNWTKDGGLQISNLLMYERRKDLEGVVVRTASMQSWPATYLQDGQWRGFLIRLWKEIASLINCTSVDVKSENSVGMKMDNGSWSGLVGKATRNEIDVLVAEIVIDKERSRALDFFHPITKSRFQIYTRHLGYQWQWDSVLRPFAGNVWAASIGWIIVATLFWAFVHRICVSEGLGSMDFGKLALMDSFFFVLQAFCQQGYDTSPTSYACRVFLFVSYAISSVLIPSYSASLVSSLAQKQHLRSFDSLQEMVADGSYRLLVKENTAQHAFLAVSTLFCLLVKFLPVDVSEGNVLQHSKDDLFKRAYTKLVEPVPPSMRKFGVRDSLKALCNFDDVAMLGVEDIVDGRLLHILNLDCPVVHLSNPVSTIHITMAAAKNYPYWGLINFHLGKLLNLGVVERLRRSEFPLGNHAALHVKDSNPEVGMQEVISAFVFVGVFVALSAFFLLLEIFRARHKAIREGKKRKRRLLWQDKRKTPFRYATRTPNWLRTTDFFFPKSMNEVNTFGYFFGSYCLRFPETV